MSLFKRIFAKENPNIVMRPLYDAVVGEARQLGWYEKGSVPDTVDGRFDMIAAILSLVLIRLEGDRKHAQQSAWLMEHFVTDMDGQLRQIGVGDMVVGKHVKKIMGALGGRLEPIERRWPGKVILNQQSFVTFIAKSHPPRKR